LAEKRGAAASQFFKSLKAAQGLIVHLAFKTASGATSPGRRSNSPNTIAVPHPHGCELAHERLTREAFNVTEVEDQALLGHW
jgi:hypothetical protein